ncbi:MAG: arginine deiminase-related protein [Flavobacteriaceae bacterium]|nr:arginine deiminase-related protein [Flavobacteriaceae bacterium]
MHKNQITSHILMIRPANFRTNEETAINNFYQKTLINLSADEIQAQALKEFDSLVELLKTKGIEVIVVSDKNFPNTPDAIFPNNWISFHENGDVALYPMFAPNRRLERREDILDILEDKGFLIENMIDYSSAENDEIFLEGTGSMTLDRENQNAYCAISARSDEELFIEFCEDFDYNPIVFSAYQTANEKREKIYHTNVMMTIGKTFAVVCLDCIDDAKERKNVIQHLRESKKEIISITEKQVGQFAGNMIHVKGAENKSFIVMSEKAYQSLSHQQKNQLEKHGEIIYSDVNTIETCGGGSVRCMMTEVFLPKI